MTAVLNGHEIGHANGKQLHSNSIFDRVCVETKKKPESLNSGKKTNLDSVRESDNGKLNTPIISDAPNLYKQNGVSVSNISPIQISNYIQLNRCESAFWLMANHPNAYLLLNLVAMRAQRTPNAPSGLEVGEALIGDYEAIGATRGQYRAALKVLTRMKYLTISETCRNRKKATTVTTTVGTKVKLLNSDIWNINPEPNNHRNDHRATTERPPSDHEQESKLSISSISHTTMATTSDSQARPTKFEKIYFDWEKKKLMGIEQTDLQQWAVTFQNVNVPEYLKFIEADIGIKPTKYKNRKRIIQTVLIYFKNENENALSRLARQKGYAKPPKPKLNHDTTPSLPSKNLSFAEEV